MAGIELGSRVALLRDIEDWYFHLIPRGTVGEVVQIVPTGFHLEFRNGPNGRGQLTGEIRNAASEDLLLLNFNYEYPEEEEEDEKKD